MKNLVSSIQADVEALIAARGSDPEREALYLARVRDGLALLSSQPPTLPAEPPPGLLFSMASRLYHDFGLDENEDSPIPSGFSPQRRERVLTDMRRLYDEVAGQGFFKW